MSHRCSESHADRLEVVHPRDAAGRRAATARSCGWPCRPSWRWSPSRCSCSPTPRSSATSAPRSSPASASPAPCCRPRSGCASSSPTAPPRRVARHLGAGDLRGALAQGIDGLWLAVAHRRASPPCAGVLAGRARWSGCSAPAPTSTGHADDVPADRLPRRHPAAGHARRDRRAARPPGHPHAAGRRGRPATSLNVVLNLAARLRPRPRHRRLRARHRLAQLGVAPPRWSWSWSAPPAAQGASLRPDLPGDPPRPRTPASRWSSARSPCAPRCWSRRTPSPAGRSARRRTRHPPARADASGRSWPSPSTRSRSPRRRSPAATSAPATSTAPGR